MIIPLSVKNQSIDSSGITNDYRDAISEYIWNGFEAHARNINIDYTLNEAYGVKELIITDNGDGINYDELGETFGAFLASKKNLLSLKMKSKANKGKGRFSFIAFADKAEWSTVYKDKDDYKEYQITMSNDTKEVIDCSQPESSDRKESGTSVRFSDINTLTAENMSFEILEPALLKEFAWFLYLYKSKNVEITVNGDKVDFEKYVNTKLSEKSMVTIDGHRFEISLVVWQESIKEKFCCYYFDSEDALKGKDTTNFNRNTINFNHSVFVKSDFFDDKENVLTNNDDIQINMFESQEEKKILKKLHKEIQKLIEKKISVYLSDKAEEAVEAMITERKTFPEFPSDVYGQMRKNDLKKVTKEIFKLEPLIFHKLKPIQEKSLLGFLNLLLSSEERENVLTILEQIVELSPEQRDDFSKILKKTSLENIIDTIKFIEDRYKIIELLRSIVYDLTKFSNERDHVQKIVERHFWLFGEQYNLASADQRMQKALEQYRNILYGEEDVTATLNPDAENERRMDIFMCNTRNVETAFETTLEENIVVELKAPKVPLTKKVLRQIEDYMDYVRRQPQFNSKLRKWKFIAVCKEVDDYVKSQYKAFEDKGKVGLVFQVENCEVYALTWDDIIKSFEIKHKPMLERLKYDREQVANELMEEVNGAEGREKADALTEIAVAQV
ncbi:ATP-binding protein [Coprococcus comes]|uniref:ATP-binding protein n=1 Tax=Coprococcus comes TaxID=410072 RepID=UPI001B3C528D|nr:ATP-binding protein [Coprococcus comes]